MVISVTRKPLAGNTSAHAITQFGDRELIVWQYGGITKNHRAKSVPRAVVFFRHIDSNGVLGDFTRRSVAATHLGLLRAGTIWKGGRRVADTVLQVEKFKVDFSDGAWAHTSPADCAKRGMPNPIDQVDFPLYFHSDKNWLLDFPLENGRNLLIPCLEFLIRFYGRSEEVPRVLLAYPWEEVEKHFYAPFDQPTRPNAWPIKLTKRLRNGDVVFLAHAKYDSYARRAAKSIYAQVEAAFGNREEYAFPKIAPWFQGPAEIKAGGWWINGGRTFLGLRVIGGSDPMGEIIQRDRENPNKTDSPADGDVVDTAWDGAPIKVIKKPPDIVDLTDAEEPDQGAPTVEIEEDEFEQLGVPRTVIDVRRERAKTSSGKPRDTGEPGEFSTGEPHGGGKGVGNAAIHARPTLESHGMVRDMWDAMRHLAKTKPDRIASVEWFTLDKGFQSDPVPQLIALDPFDDDDMEISSELRRWPYYDIGARIPRGVLVARIVADGKQLHIVEIQRRPVRKKDGDGVKEGEESFKGLVFELKDEDQFAAWLKRFLPHVRYVRGVVARLVGECAGNAAAFKHSSASAEEVAGMQAVTNALKKMDVVL